MYLQDLRNRHKVTKTMPTDSVVSQFDLEYALTIVDATLNSWLEAHAIYAHCQKGKDVITGEAHSRFTTLVKQVAVMQGEQMTWGLTYPAEILAFYLLIEWQKAERVEDKVEDKDRVSTLPSMILQPILMPMDTAPKDGRRIIALCQQFGYDGHRHGYQPAGEAFEDIFFDGTMWQQWCGNPRTRSTHHPHPLYWTHLPVKPVKERS